MKIFKIFFFVLATCSMPLQGVLSPLADAAKRGDFASVKTIVRCGGVDINAKDELYWMPLHFAAMFGHLEIVRFLIASGADVNRTSCGGWTPLHAATASNQIDAAKILIEHGADLYKKSKEGRTPLDCLEPKQLAELLTHSENYGKGKSVRRR